jgi:SAM-dependent methyltransferase
MKVKDHYDFHLGNFYSWMVGDFAAKQLEQQTYFIQRGMMPASNKLAIDLGAGHGLQTIALATLGYRVIAVDFNRQLLTELSLRKQGLDVEVVEDDFLIFLQNTSRQAELIVCMGDTITHLDSINDVSNLIREIERLLEPRGKAVFSFRDLSKELKEEKRFIPVKSDHTKILTCFLEYFPNHVLVHDILYEKQNGEWVQRVSAYPKLRLNEEVIVGLLRDNNLAVIQSEVINGMIYLIGQKS